MEKPLLLAPEDPIDPAETNLDADQPVDSGFGEILAAFETEAKENDAESSQAGLLKGQVLRITPEGVFVDIGRKVEGLLPLDYVPQKNGDVLLQLGQDVEVTVAGRTEDGYYRLSATKVEAPKDWSALEAAFEAKATVAGVVKEVVKGGLRVEVGGERAFMPASRSGARDVAEMAKLVGQTVDCRITKLDKEANDLVVDRRLVLEALAAKRKQEAFSSLAEGQVVRGRVRTLTEFGAFVNLGEVDGLLHVSDMSWTRISKPADLLAEGQEIEVKILKLNPETRKLSLGMKQLQPEPWSQVADKLSVGARISGKVTRLVEFGAFVELFPGVEGLIRTIDLSWDRRVRKPADVLNPGDVVEVQVLDLKLADKKIGLGLKQLVVDPWQAAREKFPLGAIFEGPIVDLQKFGAFVEILPGVEGLIHVSDITREKRIEHPKDVLSVGQVVKAAVSEYENDRRRIRLSIKQLEPTNADHFMAEHQVGELVTGRVSDLKEGKAKVQLAEGVTGNCPLPRAEAAASSGTSGGKADVSALSAMLTARWKEGSTSASEKNELRVGQIRQFKIASMDPNSKRIELEIAGSDS
ncbi:MAG: S1 RNA-binding domain-containing protein [Bryobacter sp.]|nr:S1 RNA-binding domain-containing protein [Bryobacter sp.]